MSPENYIGLFGFIFIAAMVGAGIGRIFRGPNTRKRLKQYELVRVGMTENEMLSIMGEGYDRSSLKDGRYKYEWRMNSSSYGRYGARTYTGVRKVSIYIKNGRVEEIRPYNVN